MNLHATQNPREQTLVLLGELQTVLTRLSAEIDQILLNNEPVDHELFARIMDAIGNRYQSLSDLNQYPTS